ncbi:hypothetical protein BGZ94_006015, partial [Podila epigama]
MATQPSTNPETDSTNPFVRTLHRHYSDTTYKRSSATIERERYLFAKVPFNRWAMFPTAF